MLVGHVPALLATPFAGQIISYALGQPKTVPSVSDTPFRWTTSTATSACNILLHTVGAECGSKNCGHVWGELWSHVGWQAAEYRGRKKKIAQCC